MSESLGKRIHGLRGAARLTAIGEVVSQWRASGTSRAAFCREVGIAPVTLGRWIGRLEAANGEQGTGPVFVELDAPRRRAAEPFEIVLSSGSIVRVPAGFAGDDLSRLLDVLSTTC